MSLRLKFKSTRSGILLHLTQPHWLTVVTPATIEEVNIEAPSTLDPKPAGPTSIKDLGATTKDMLIRADDHLIHRAAKVAIVVPTRR